MDRLACVDLPAFGLQILLGHHPDWQGWPCALVSRDTPQGKILATCEKGRQQGIQPGQSYAAGLALVPELRAGILSPDDFENAKTAVCEQLRSFSPNVEPSKEEPGTFWLDATGLDYLHTSLESWAEALRDHLKKSGFFSTVVVGYSHFGTFALARAHCGIAILCSPEDEVAATSRVPLSLLGLPPSKLFALLQLGQRTIGDLLRLPSAGLLERFGPEVYRIHRLASGTLFTPLMPVFPPEPPCESVFLDYPESNALRLTFLVKRLLRPLLSTAACRHEHLTELEIALTLDRKGKKIECLRTAAPTLDEAQIIDLVRLRLESISLPVGATEIRLSAKTVPASPHQLHLFPAYPRRDLEAADRALARLRAEFGHGAVVRAKILDGHLPEARFSLEPLEHAALPNPLVTGRAKVPLNLVRRIFARPIPLQTRPLVSPRGCHLTGMGEAPACRITGPYVISGGWWVRYAHREYHFAETEAGQILWVYFDKRRRSWFLHGEVE